MSISTYKKWMKESFLYEVDDDKVIGKNDKDEPVTVRQALDSSSDNPTMVKLKKKAQDLRDKDGDDKEKKKPVSIDIDASGGLGDDDAEPATKDEPKDIANSIEGNQEAQELANDLAQGHNPKYTEEELVDQLKDMGHGDLAHAIYNADGFEEKAAIIAKASGIEPDDMDDEDDDSEGDYDEDDMEMAQDDLKYAEEELAQAQEYLEYSQEELKMAQDPDEIKQAREIVAQDKKEYERALQAVKKAQKEIVKLRGESITFNGKKYKAIKESVNKRITVKEVHTWLKSLEEFRYRKIPNVDARRITSFVNNGLSETDLPQSLQKKWGSAKYSKEKGLADRFIKQRISQKLTQNESKHPIKEQYDRLFKNKVIL